MKVITQKAIDKIKGNNICIAKLMILFKGIHQGTIVRWLHDRDIRLITPSALEIIVQETGLKEKDIVEIDSGTFTSTGVKIIRSRKKKPV